MRVPPVVDRAWLRDRDVVLADVRWYLDGRSGRAAYDAGHLPGAVFVDVDRDLAAPHGSRPSTAGRHPLPDPAAFAAAMGALGIADDDLVVAYDDAGGVIAARLVWMLRATGLPAALLDGGLRPDDRLSTEPARRPPATFEARPWPADRIADLADAVEPGNVILDARNRDRYRGDVEPVDPRPGHIPGARNLPARENLTADGFVLPVAELLARFAAVGVRGPDAAACVVSSCGSGVTACHTLLLLDHAGLGEGRLYPGSWSAYSSDPDLPAATGDEPGRPGRVGGG
jgi:thiosulfate/3-mercaptopyruvate sulfurtransferase